jgi:formylglycine-generating enzyme
MDQLIRALQGKLMEPSIGHTDPAKDAPVSATPVTPGNDIAPAVRRGVRSRAWLWGACGIAVLALVGLIIASSQSPSGGDLGSVNEPPPIKPPPMNWPCIEEEAKASQTAWAKYLGKKVEEEINIGGGIKMKFELIPPGTFTMVSDLLFPHIVELSNPFYLAKYECSQEQYVTLTGRSNPSGFDGKGEIKKDGSPIWMTRMSVAGMDTSRFPVETVDWGDADLCCKNLVKILRSGWSSARLPTEAEWEWACRAGTKTTFHTGNSLGKGDAKFDSIRPWVVSSGTPNAFALYNMHGNVWEWCSDWKGNFTTEKAIDPCGPGTGSERVIRGGCWTSSPTNCGSSSRDGVEPNQRSSILGFRVALLPSGL